ncbi:MAG: HigA family addiction module antidote protein [Alphaproteobacteria bacterium]|nr:HigA family addiction module antidote protein [Alphaproteobacteria bacterium]
MAEYVAKRNPSMVPMHPGVLVTEAVESLRMPVTKVADAIGISRQHLYAIMNERKPVTPEVATRLGKAFGNGPELWIRLQVAYDLWHARKSVDLSKVAKLKAA